jgi:hypothetical protein
VIVDLLQSQVSQGPGTVSLEFVNSFNRPLALAAGQSGSITTPDGTRSFGNIIPPCGKMFTYVRVTDNPQLKLTLTAQ